MSKKQPALITLTGNPALDITISVDEVQPHHTHRLSGAARKLGGKGINVSTVAAEQGYETVILGPLSEPDYIDCLRRDILPTNVNGKITLAFSDTHTPLRSTFAIHTRKDNNTSIFNEAGEAHDPEVYDSILERLRKALKDHPRSVVTVSGSFAPQCPEDFLGKVVELTHDLGGRIIVDTAGEPLRRACALQVDVVKPNIDELAETTGTADISQGAHALMNLGAKTVVVSAGPDGLYYFGPDGACHAKLPRQLDGNPTGAGDAAVSALGTAMIDSLSFEETLVRAVAWSAAAVLMPLAGNISPEWHNLATEVIVQSL
ncbi:MAG: PfkB family carbohydrate kinase [Corynebacterium sp.]|nr:PfkB family carbohydrate kinase [Corynebacterium sp.]